MAYRESEVPLDEQAREWLRLRITTAAGTIVAFTVQYETTIADRRIPVVRYDGAYGRAHRDLLDRRGRVVDTWRLPGDPSYKDGLEIGRRDLLANWATYRAAFLGEPP
jgi:hypothetical protein